MLYKELVNRQLNISAKTDLEIDAQTGCILIPLSNEKIFLNWLSEKDKLIATHKLTEPTHVTKRVKLIKPNDRDVIVLQIELLTQNG
jgi:hypothetical protein